MRKRSSDIMPPPAPSPSGFLPAGDASTLPDNTPAPRAWFVRRLVIIACVLLCFPPGFPSGCSPGDGIPAAAGDDGYGLWLKYTPPGDETLLAEYRANIARVRVPRGSATLRAARQELDRGLDGLLGTDVQVTEGTDADLRIVISPGKDAGGPQDAGRGGNGRDEPSGGPVTPPGDPEGYAIRSGDGTGAITIASAGETGLLYGVFRFLRLLRTGASIDTLDIASAPAIRYRILNHWDNPDGTVERGYAGKSLWKWDLLPDSVDPRYSDYARANASIGINGAVLNNVNADPVILTAEYLAKAAAIAGALRPYGIRVFLSANFSSPMPGRYEQEGDRKGGIGDLPTADPLDPGVREWWKTKAAGIYRLIPDFGGFLVKASSEGMPGPQDFGRTHADGANMLADAVAPFGGIVMWRAFVYDPGVDPDRIKRSYLEFVPLDGRFRPNVFVQAKNGPLDFQPREPVQPLFGAMPGTPLMPELQVTQEYLGHSTHLVYLAPMWKEYLEFDTYAHGPGSTLASIVSRPPAAGGAGGERMTGIAGVANIGDDRNWCGHLFAQANWYAYGRLAWDPAVSAEAIADDWVRMTLTRDPAAAATIVTMMMGSWEACVDYMTPLGLHHIMQEGFHYGPEPSNDRGREDWRSTYYHRADSAGIGFDRSSTGSNAVGQYHSPLRETFDDTLSCPEKYLLWFHHVGWDRRMRSGRTLWEELCARYHAGTEYVDSMARDWSSVESAVDPELFAHVRSKLEQQKTDASAWRDTCLSYFREFSRMPVYVPGSDTTGAAR